MHTPYKANDLMSEHHICILHVCWSYVYLRPSHPVALSCLLKDDILPYKYHRAPNVLHVHRRKLIRPNRFTAAFGLLGRVAPNLAQNLDSVVTVKQIIQPMADEYTTTTMNRKPEHQNERQQTKTVSHSAEVAPSCY